MSRQTHRRSLFFAWFGVFAAVAISATPSSARPPFSTYHDATGADHQASFNSLMPQGYRMVSLGVHGDPRAPHYSATWVQQPGPAFFAFHGRVLSEYQAIFNEWTGKGYHPTILSVTGSGPQAAIAGVFEQKAGPIPLTRFDLVSGDYRNSTTIEYWMSWAKTNNQIPAWISLYGTLAAPRWAVIMKPNTSKLSWDYGLLDNLNQMQMRFNAETAQWARPAFLTQSNYQRYAALYVDNQVGPWIARSNLNWQQYQNEITARVAEGYYPLVVQGGGAGAATTWSAILVKDNIPAPRVWNAQGSGTAALSPFDNAIKAYMQSTQTRGAGLAVAKNGKLVYAKGFTWSEAGYPQTTPTSLFRVASLTKPITSIAIHQLMQQAKIFLGTAIQDVIHLKTPSGGAPVDPRVDDIRLQQVLSHRTGWDRDIVYDLPEPRDVANAFGTTLPITKTMWARQKLTATLEHDPGSQYAYSNLGFLLLGMVLENFYPGKTYEQIIQQQIFSPLGLTRPRIARAKLSEAAPGQVRFHENDLRIAPTVLDNSGTWVPLAYGGEDYRNFDSFGGWLFSPVDYAKVLASFDKGNANPILNANGAGVMWTAPYGDGAMRGWFRRDLGGGVWAAEHGGAMPGVGTAMGRRSDGISIVVFTNSGMGTDLLGQLYGIASAIPAASWPNVDYFPTYGVPSL